MRLAELPRPDLDRIAEETLAPPEAFLRAMRQAEQEAEYGVPIEQHIERERAAGNPLGPFHRHWLLETRSPEHVRAVLRRAAQGPQFYGMPSQDFTGVLSAQGGNTAAFTARNTLATELNIIGDTAAAVTPQAMINQYCAIPAGDPRAGRVYRLDAAGIYGNTGTPTIIWTPRWGSSTTVATNISLGASGTFTTITGTTNLPWYAYLTCWVRTSPPGATLGTVYAVGIVNLGIPVTSSQFSSTLYMGGGTAATTVDTSGQGAAGVGITLNTTWSASSASNTVTTQGILLRSLN